jgi:asparagine synthase (glutamine-hydrolysing)
VCGIAGIIETRGSRPIDGKLLRAMNNSLEHRGPDGSGYHEEPGIGLAHRRLSIIDLAAGQQPMYNEDRSVCVVFNGEIYNFADLVDELTALGHRFQTHCDTEVIVHAWEQWGPECLQRFNGMFAFALWDRNSKTVFLARDRLGIKPLFYSFLSSGQLIFASELKALMIHPEFPRTISPRAIEEYFTFGYVPDPGTIYEGVHKLEPGWQLTLDVRSGRNTSGPYWQLNFDGRAQPPISQTELCEELVTRLRKAVRLQLVSDVPLGAFLSGGVDSSAVVALMADLSGDKVRTCSIAFDDREYDESRYARLVAESKGTAHSEKRVEVDDFALLEKLVSIYDEPYADSSAIPTYRVCEAARERVTVALSGDGGDEDFAGYRRYRLFMAEERVRSAIPSGLRRSVFGALGRYYPKLDWAPRVFRGKTTFQALARDGVGAYLHGVSITPEEVRQRIYSPKLRQQLAGYTSRDVFDRHVGSRKFPDALSQVQYLDFKTYLPGDILTKVDRASMAHSLEVRVPFLDHEFVEWVAGLPASVKLRGGEGKFLLKKALEPVLPREILYRRKMGFAVPLERWFREPLAARVRSLPDSPWLRESGVFDEQGLRTITSQHLQGRRNYSPLIWALLMFEGFLRR